MTENFTYKQIGNISPGQDGAIFGGFIFRLDTAGRCTVFSFDTLEKIAAFELDQIDTLVPHSNAVCFGTAKYDESDAFPLLYTNIYNNYQKAEDRKEGLCCVYRIIQNGNTFTSRLVQTIQIGFTDKKGLWISENTADVRPYGNFLVDGKSEKLYVYTMLDEANVTRFFEFPLPKLSAADGEVQAVILKETDIASTFDGPYIYYMQGAVLSGGRIIASQGFENDRPGIRIYDLNQKRELLRVSLMDYGLTHEPELFEVYNDKIYYSDAEGNFYQVTFGL